VTAIKESGTDGKNNLIRSQKPIKLLHEVVKAEYIRNQVHSNLIYLQSDQSNGEISVSGFFKKKNQDICVIPNLDYSYEIHRERISRKGREGKSTQRRQTTQSISLRPFADSRRTLRE